MTILCYDCKKTAELRSINQFNIFDYICKSCALKSMKAKEITNEQIKCIDCHKIAKYIIISQLNRISNYCDKCIFKEFKFL